MHANLHMQAMTVDAPGLEPFVLVRVAVDCDVCGEHDFVLAGHHLKPVVELLQRLLTELDPALVESGEVAQVYRSSHEIPDPRSN